ncbi:hypothetical protein ACIBKX_40305 [Streptomyces sp. NPDC050658]|uniref:hypothetical protein n=1 Tax=unclassified Streptomyces TaxID=2593676 RepID=UPI00343CF96F
MVITMASAPTGGLFEDWEGEDDDLGPMPDETEGRFERIVISSSVGPGRAPLALRSSGLQQCDNCGAWLGVTAWTCPACTAKGHLTGVRPQFVHQLADPGMARRSVPPW